MDYDTNQAFLFRVGLDAVQVQCVLRGLDCRGAWGEIIQRVEAQEAIPPDLSIEGWIRKYFPEEPEVMKKIFKCESNLRQWNNDGSVVTGKAGEKGLTQIHPVHFKDAKEKGINVLSLEGNLQYARLLYDTERGKKHWSCYSK